MYCLQNGILNYFTNKFYYHIYWQNMGNTDLKQKYTWKTFNKKCFAYECY